VTESVGTTNLGIDAQGESGPNVRTLGLIPAKKTFAKPG
jgi:hypothetical protein